MRRLMVAIGLCPVLAMAGELAAAAKNVRLIVAHRGSSVDRPENTLAAYRRAIEAGAGAIEVDLRLTRDGHLVSLHDAKLERTTNGSGLVGEFTLAEVQRLDAGGKFDPRYRGERVPSFPEILQVAKGRVDVLLDLKGEGEAYVRRVVSDIRQYGEPARIIVGMRNEEDARLFRRELPEARLLGLIPSAAAIERFVAAGAGVIRLWPKWLTDATLAPRVKKAGAGLLIAADKGTREEVVPLLAAEPVWIFTDDPERLGRTLAELRQR